MRIGMGLRTWGEKGGIGVYTRQVVKNLLNLDRKNQYYLFFQDRTHLTELPDHDNVHLIHVPVKNRLFWDQVTMPWYAKKCNVDVIFHAKFSIPLFTSKKTVMVLHGTERFFYPQFTQAGHLLFFHTVYPYYLKRATAIIAVSERGRQDIITQLGLSPNKVHTVHLAASPIFRIIKDEAYLSQVRQKYHLPERFLLNVGHVYPGKNIGRLFRALAQVRQQEDVHLVIAGSYRWKYRHDLKILRDLKLEPYVDLTDHVPHEDLVGFYNLAELVAFPSIYESFPAIPLEANACGCPVVTSHTGGTPEAAGDATIYVDPEDVAEITDGILQVLTNEAVRGDLVERGLQNVERFSWKKTARKTLYVLESLGN